MSLQVMLGGSWFQQSFGDPAGAPTAALLQRAQRAVREQLGLQGTPVRSLVRVQQVGDDGGGTGGAMGQPGGWWGHGGTV